MHHRFLNAQNVTPVKPGEDITGIHNFDIFVIQVREGLPDQMLPKFRHCLNGGGGLTLTWIFVKDLSTCTEGPQR